LRANDGDGEAGSKMPNPSSAPLCAIAVLVVTLTLLFLGQEAKAQSLGEMKQNCEQLESHWRVYPPTKDNASVPHQADAAICFGFMQAFIGLSNIIGIPSAYDPNCAGTPEGKVVGGPLCGHSLGICFPKGLSYSQMLAVFLAYARSHAVQWHEGAARHFQNAMMTTFPCTDEYPVPAPR
jgi:hypothetical protein